MDFDARRHADSDFAQLVKLALDGDRDAWERLVHRLQRVVWRAVAGFDLSTEDRKDAFAATFFRLHERLGTIREPVKLPGWVATTARNEVLTILRARRRTTVVETVEVPAVDHAVDEERLMDAELRAALRAAFVRLSSSCQELLRMVTAEPPLSYAEVGELLAMPHGSIGPTRQRCLQRLREAPELRPYLEGAGA